MTAETTEKRANPTADTLAKIDQWMQRLADETDQAAQSAELTRYLTTLARFYTYSAHNCALIAMQRPDARRVAGYRAWQAMGRQVKKGAKGIAILCPAPIKGKTDAGDDAVIALRFRTGWVFDLADTEGDDLPALTVHVETAAGPIADGAATPAIHHDLAAKDLLPDVHLVDTAYLDAELLVESRDQYEVELLGPTRRDRRWQARAEEGFGAADFVVDWDRRQATCPGGQLSIQWDERIDSRGNDSVYIRFAKAACGPCPDRARCTKAPRRSIAIRPRRQYQALQERRALEETEAFAREYARRAGIEGTISQGVRAFGLRRAKYIGLAKTHLQHVVTAAAIDFVRVGQWLDEVPLAKTRRSSFVRLMNPESAAA